MIREREVAWDIYVPILWQEHVKKDSVIRIKRGKFRRFETLLNKIERIAVIDDLEPIGFLACGSRMLLEASK
jgi:hypothetical protein